MNYYRQYICLLFVSILSVDALFIMPSYKLKGIRPVFMGEDENVLGIIEIMDNDCDCDCGFDCDFDCDFDCGCDNYDDNYDNDNVTLNYDNENENGTLKYDLRGSKDFVENEKCIRPDLDKITATVYCGILLLAGILTYAV